MEYLRKTESRGILKRSPGLFSFTILAACDIDYHFRRGREVTEKEPEKELEKEIVKEPEKELVKEPSLPHWWKNEGKCDRVRLRIDMYLFRRETDPGSRISAEGNL